jgi:hypothetical protein
MDYLPLLPLRLVDELSFLVTILGGVVRAKYMSITYRTA